MTGDFDRTVAVLVDRIRDLSVLGCFLLPTLPK